MAIKTPETRADLQNLAARLTALLDGQSLLLDGVTVKEKATMPAFNAAYSIGIQASELAQRLTDALDSINAPEAGK